MMAVVGWLCWLTYGWLGAERFMTWVVAFGTIMVIYIGSRGFKPLVGLVASLQTQHSEDVYRADRRDLSEKNLNRALASPRLPSAFSKSIGLTLCGMVDEPTSLATVFCLKYP